jgi:superfamily II DNA or RNA helicase
MNIRKLIFSFNLSNYEENIGYIYITYLSRDGEIQISKLGTTIDPHRRHKQYFPCTHYDVSKKFDYLYAISYKGFIKPLKSKYCYDIEKYFKEVTIHWKVDKSQNPSLEARYCSVDDLDKVFQKEVIPFIEKSGKYSCKKVEMKDVPKNIMKQKLRKYKPKTIGTNVPEAVYHIEHLHQKEAIEKIFEERPERAQIIAPTGSGKTYTITCILKILGFDKINIVLSNTTLVQQFYESIRPFFDEHKFVILSSEFKSFDNDPNISTNMDEKSLFHFMNEHDKFIILTTSMSSDKIKKGEFDATIFDEAHHQAGEAGTKTRKLVDDTDTLKIKYRFFFTATPRFVNENGTIEVASMDNIEKFGPIIHYTSLYEAISRGICNDIRLEFVSFETNNDSKSVKDTIATLMNQIQFCERKHIIVYFRENKVSKKHCKAFEKYCDENELDINIYEVYQDTEKSVLNDFKNDNDTCVLFNCNIAIEGFDDRLVDCVYITYPIKSFERFSQIVGRAIRIHPSKSNISTVVLNGHPNGYDDVMGGLFTLSLYDGRYINITDVSRSTLVIKPSNIIGKLVDPDGNEIVETFTRDEINARITEIVRKIEGGYILSKSDKQAVEVYSFIIDSGKCDENGWFRACDVVNNYENFCKLNPELWYSTHKTPKNTLSANVTKNWVKRGYIERTGNGTNSRFRFINIPT